MSDGIHRASPLGPVALRTASTRAALTKAALAFAVMSFVALAPAFADAATATHKVRMYWNYGPIEVELYGTDSPRHVANFMLYADSGRYDNTFVHRVEAGAAKFVQGGGFTVPASPTINNLVSQPVAPFKQIKNEFNVSNGLSNTPGSLAAARTASLDSATAQWFFNVTNNAGGFDPGPYTVYGQITDGFDWFSQVPYVNQLQDSYPQKAGTYEATTPLVNGTTLITLYETVEISLQPGDFNNDGIVNQADRDVWQAASVSQNNLAADADGDSNVDEDDLAIWQANLGEGVLRSQLPGDYNRDGQVSTADFLWWQTLYGSTITRDADGNGDGVVNTADFTIWRDAMAAAGTAVSIPEATSKALMALGLLGAAPHRRG